MTWKWKWKTVCQAAGPRAFRMFTPSAPRRSCMRAARRFAAAEACAKSSSEISSRSLEWFLGITSAWPLVQGLMSMKAMVSSSSWTTSAGSSPAAILQKMQSSGTGAGSLQPPGLAEPPIEEDADASHQQQRQRVADRPAELRHVLEVHAVDAGDHRRNRCDRHPGGDLAHVLVLANAHLR